MTFKVSVDVAGPENIRSKIQDALQSGLSAYKDVTLTSEADSLFHVSVFSVEVETQVYLSVTVTRSVWSDVEFWLRRALLDAWERIHGKAQGELMTRGKTVNEIVDSLGPDDSFKQITDHWPMVTTVERLAKASEKIVTYVDTKFLEAARRRSKAAEDEDGEDTEDTTLIRHSMDTEDVRAVIKAGEQVLAEKPAELSTPEPRAETGIAPPGPRQRIIKAKDILADIRMGMTRDDLMVKYNLSPKGLQNSFNQLVNAGAIEPEELPGEATVEKIRIQPRRQVRGEPRFYLDFDLPVSVVGESGIKGRVRDITEDGIGLAGIESEVDELKRLIILGDEFGEVDPFDFEAICRWIRKESGEGDYLSGFQITNISDENMGKLRQLIRIVTFED